MAKLCAKTDCLGCGACAAVCAADALKLEPDENGFFRPAFEPSRCAECGNCAAVCPSLSETSDPDSSFAPRSYFCWNRDSGVRRASSSGGLFSVFAEQVLREGGTVYGAVYDESMNVILARASSSGELAPMRGSKYIEADPSALYRDLPADLSRGIPVLLSGTPCQIDAVRNFLTASTGTETVPENLYLVDFICHGVASPALWQSYVHALETKYRASLFDARFRDKSVGGWKSPSMRFRFRGQKDRVISWSTVFPHLENTFITVYHKNLALRESCYHCSRNADKRSSDITLADARSLYRNPKFAAEARDGLSQISINTARGDALFRRCVSQISAVSCSDADAPSSVTPSIPALRETFLNDARTLDFEQLRKKYRKVLAPKFRLGTFFNAVLKSLFGAGLALRIREAAAKTAARLRGNRHD